MLADMIMKGNGVPYTSLPQIKALKIYSPELCMKLTYMGAETDMLISVALQR